MDSKTKLMALLADDKLLFVERLTPAEVCQACHDYLCRIERVPNRAAYSVTLVTGTSDHGDPTTALFFFPPNHQPLVAEEKPQP